jgi:hypothetical protein
LITIVGVGVSDSSASRRARHSDDGAEERVDDWVKMTLTLLLVEHADVVHHLALGVLAGKQ